MIQFGSKAFIFNVEGHGVRAIVNQCSILADLNLRKDLN